MLVSNIPPKIVRKKIIIEVKLSDVLPLTILSKFKRIGTLFDNIYMNKNSRLVV